MKELKIHSGLAFIVVMALLTGCETAQQSGARLPKDTRTRIAFNTSDTLYTGGLGEAGVEGFCRRIRNYLVNDLADRGITAASDTDGSGASALITITLSSIESKVSENMGFFLSYASYKPHANYSATLQSPSGTTVVTWRHDVSEDTVDKLGEHMASDIAKYLSRGFR
jgi:hypothetical protein